MLWRPIHGGCTSMASRLRIRRIHYGTDPRTWRYNAIELRENGSEPSQTTGTSHVAMKYFMLAFMVSSQLPFQGTPPRPDAETSVFVSPCRDPDRYCRASYIVILKLNLKWVRICRTRRGRSLWVRPWLLKRLV